MMAAGQERWAMTPAGSGQTFACRQGQSLLTAMIMAGQTAIKVGCRNGGCGVCRVKVLSGSYSSEKMTRSRISEADEAQGIVLACRIAPNADLTFEPLPLKPAGTGV
jgi:ferredoxin